MFFPYTGHYRVEQSSPALHTGFLLVAYFTYSSVCVFNPGLSAPLPLSFPWYCLVCFLHLLLYFYFGSLFVLFSDILGYLSCPSDFLPSV